MVFTLAGAMSLYPTSAEAQSSNCAERGQVIKKLQESYGEELAFGGLQKTRGGQAVMEVWTSKQTGSYTVLITHANGISCIVSVGTDFFEAIPKVELDDDA